MTAAGSGLFSPTVDDVLRLAILVAGIVNIVAVSVALRFMRRYVRVLLDIEQYAREARNRMERDVTTMAHAMASLKGEIGRFRLVPPAGTAETSGTEPAA